MIDLLVIRHGPTDWNEAGLIQGRTDRLLSEAGRAEVGAWRLPPGWEAARCLASPLARTMDTARLLGLQPIPEPRLFEMAWGAWEGGSLATLRGELGAAMRENEARGLDFRPVGGESPRDVQARLRPWLAELAGPTVAVTHKGVLRALYAMASGWTMTGKAGQKLLPACAHHFRVDSHGNPTVAELNMALMASR
jgi:probable phosphoglycerate mutase